jgi:23S rRNA A1618 N6-methylase RlmF
MLSIVQKIVSFIVFVDGSVYKNKFGGYSIDWQNPYAVRSHHHGTSHYFRELTKSLLHHDFHIEIELPIDQLCPTVKNPLSC